MKRLIMMAVGCTLLSVPAFAQGDAAKGEKVYTAQKCAMCHSIADKGNKKNPLDGVGAKLKADDVKKWIQTPAEFKSDKKPPMKAYPSLPKGDLDDLVAYMMSLKK